MDNILKRKENAPINIQISQYHKKTLNVISYNKHLFICANTVTEIINQVNKIESKTEDCRMVWKE